VAIGASATTRRIVAAALAVLVVGCGSSSPTRPSAGASLDQAYTLARQEPGLTSFVVARDGVIARQEYFNGGGADAPQDVRSVTKSVTSLLVGLAIGRGCLRSVDQSIGEVLGPLAPADPAKSAITVRHLLTMTSGLGGDELANPNEYNLWAAAPDQMAYVLAQPLVAAPGTRFAYYSPAYHILSVALTEACGAKAVDLARDHLFMPLGFGARAWETDDQGYSNGAAGVSLTPNDMVALGALVLNGGRAGGGQIVPAVWIQASTRGQVPTSAMSYASAYGYGWWTGQSGGSDYAFATGWGGQFLFVVPAKRLVIVATARWRGLAAADAQAQWLRVADIIVRLAIPAF
jgi:CubicO group peptidase (beta-lactamase class C family)